MRIKPFIKLITRKVNYLANKTNKYKYSENPFAKPYSNTFVWIDDKQD